MLLLWKSTHNILLSCLWFCHHWRKAHSQSYSYILNQNRTFRRFAQTPSMLHCSFRWYRSFLGDFNVQHGWNSPSFSTSAHQLFLESFFHSSHLYSFCLSTWWFFFLFNKKHQWASALHKIWLGHTFRRLLSRLPDLMAQRIATTRRCTRVWRALKACCLTEHRDKCRFCLNSIADDQKRRTENQRQDPSGQLGEQDCFVEEVAFEEELRRESHTGLPIRKTRKRGECW